MNIEQYSKITATISAELQGINTPVLILTSSNEKVKAYDEAIALCKAVTQIGKNVVLVDARLQNATLVDESEISTNDSIKTITLKPAEKAKNIINIEYATGFFNKLKESYNFIIVCCNAINTSSSAQYFTAKSDAVVLVEEKKLSRTDCIDEALTTIKNLKAHPIGFIYKK